MKEIQEKRLKGYFIDSAKEIIKAEGLKAISVRNVAARAGYSYATLYNYFKNLGDLIYYCIRDFLKECSELIEAEKLPQQSGNERIKALSLAYIKYFIQYPGIFELLFLETKPEITNNSKAIALIDEFFVELFAQEWDYCEKYGNIAQDIIQRKKEIHKAMLHGSMLYYLNRRSSFNYKEFVENLGSNIDYLLS